MRKAILEINKKMDNYYISKNSNSAMILCLGSGGSNYLTKKVAKWFVKNGINVLAVGPKEKGYVSFPLETIEQAVKFLKEKGNKNIGIIGASITSIPTLYGACLCNDISLTIAVTPCDFVLQGFSQEKKDGCKEWPVQNKSMLSYKGKDIPYEKYAYQHPDYWQTVMVETKGSGNMLVATKIYEDTEKQNPLLEEMMIPIENIKGKLLLVGCEDDCLWPTVKYIKRMQQRLKDKKDSNCDLEALVYKYGTHYAFPQSMLKSILPICSDKLIGLAFISAKQHTQQCKESRLDIEKHFKDVLDKWKEGKYSSHEI